MNLNKKSHRYSKILENGKVLSNKFVNSEKITLVDNAKIITNDKETAKFLNDFFLKLVSAIFYHIFIFSLNDRPSKTMKIFLFRLNSCFHSEDVIFPLPFRTFQILKGKWKWNNL